MLVWKDGKMSPKCVITIMTTHTLQHCEKKAFGGIHLLESVFGSLPACFPHGEFYLAFPHPRSCTETQEATGDRGRRRRGVLDMSLQLLRKDAIDTTFEMLWFLLWVS